MSWHPEPDTLYEGWMESQVAAQDHQEDRDARRDAGWPDDDGRPDPSEYADRSGPVTDDPMTFDGPNAPDFLHISKTLDCGHRVEASEESGGFDEVGHVTESMVRDLLAFKVRVHNCELTESRVAAARRVADRGPF